MKQFRLSAPLKVAFIYFVAVFTTLYIETLDKFGDHVAIDLPSSYLDSIIWVTGCYFMAAFTWSLCLWFYLSRSPSFYRLAPFRWVLALPTATIPFVWMFESERGYAGSLALILVIWTTGLAATMKNAAIAFLFGWLPIIGIILAAAHQMIFWTR